MTVRALVVGSMVADLSFRVRKLPEHGEIIVADEMRIFRGGKGYNHAIALARLGCEVTMVGAVGADQFGDGFLAALEREGIDSGRVVQLRGAATAVAAPLITPDGDAAYVQHPGANRQLAPAHCADLPDCDVLALQGEVPAASSEQAAKVIRRRGGIVLLDPTPPEEITEELLASLTVLCAHEIEATALLAARGQQLDDPVEMARALATSERAAVIRLGAALGATWCDGSQAGFVEPPPVTVIDSTGTGGAFCAALAVASVEGKPLQEAVRHGCAAAAYAATIQGAEPALGTSEEVAAMLELMPAAS